MKQIKIATICFLCFIISFLSSCGLTGTGTPMPEVFDKEFKEAFATDYQRAEANLIYVSAGITGTEVYITAEQAHEGLASGRYNLGVVKNVKDHQFVAAVQQKPIVGRGTEYLLSLYSRGESTPALQSWTIQSVSILALPEQEFSTVRLYEQDKDQKARSFIVNPLQYHMDHGAVELAVFEGAEYQEEFESLVDSYAARKAFGDTVLTGLPARELCLFLDDTARDSLKCFLLVRFEETDSLIWVARLRGDKEGSKLYMDCTKYTDREIVRLAEIDPAFAELIYEQINSVDLNQ